MGKQYNRFGTGGYSPPVDSSFVGLVVTASMAVFLAVWKFSAPVPASEVLPLASVSDAEHASFDFCHSGGGLYCVVDGDTFYYQGLNIRIADIDTPETHPPRCENEAQKGAAATRRLHGLLNAGGFTLEPTNRDEDAYGRKLRVVTRGGESIGGTLVDEGLARWYGRGRQPWC